MSCNFLFILVVCGLLRNIKAEDNNAKQVVSNSNNIARKGAFRAIPKFIFQIIRSVRNIFQIFKNILQSFEKRVISILGETLGFLARSDDTAVARRRRSLWLGDSQQGEKQNGGGVISTVSNLFMTPFKLAFGAVKWIPGAIADQSAKIGIALAVDVLENPILKSLAHTAVKTTEKIAEESWNFAKINVFPRMDKWATSARESQSLPDSALTFLAEMQTLYHIYRFLGLA